MTRFVETDCRVFRVRLVERPVGSDNWQLTITVESGPKMDREDAERVVQEIVDDITCHCGHPYRWFMS